MTLHVIIVRVACEQPSRPNYAYHQQWTTDPQQTIHDAEEQELIDQMNIALQVMDTDEHWNADLADAAHLDHLSMEEVLYSPINAAQSDSYLDAIDPRTRSQLIRSDKKIAHTAIIYVENTYSVRKKIMH